MEKTTNYQLNKPEAADPLRVADFNENADIIDAALGEVRALATTEKIVVGSFVGNGANERTVELGFTARFLLLTTSFLSNSGSFVSMLGTNHGCYISNSGVLPSESRVISGGVSLVGNGNNSKDAMTHYVAFL